MMFWLLSMVGVISMIGQEAGMPPGVRPHIDVKLAPGWHYDQSREKFISDKGDTFTTEQELPANTSIRHTAPNLAKKKPHTLSKSERNLASYVQVIFPYGTQVKDHLPKINKWPCVLEVHLPPQISLP